MVPSPEGFVKPRVPHQDAFRRSERENIFAPYIRILLQRPGLGKYSRTERIEWRKISNILGLYGADWGKLSPPTYPRRASLLEVQLGFGDNTRAENRLDLIIGIF